MSAQVNASPPRSQAKKSPELCGRSIKPEARRSTVSAIPLSYFPNPLHPHTEFSLVECFAEQCRSDFAYVASRKQWFCRSTTDDGQPCWKADETSRIFYCVRLVLQDLAAEARGNPNICTAATVRAVEELARADSYFARTEADLAPGELAKEDAQTAALLECFRRDKEANRTVEVAGPVRSTAASQNHKPQRKPPKPKASNPAPKVVVDNSGGATAPRGLIDEMARWSK